MRQWRAGLVALGVVALGVSTAGAATMRTAETAVTVADEVRDDAYVAGQSVSVTAPIMGELFAAGQTVTVTKKVDRSVFAAGTTVTLKDGAGYNAFLGGQAVTIDGEFGHDVYLAGSNVVVEKDAVVKGSLHVAAQTLTLHGRVDGDVRLTGGTITSDAVIGGTLTGEVGQLSFTGGSIAGNLRVGDSTTLVNDSATTVGGQKERFDDRDTYREVRAPSFSPPSVLKALFGLLIMGFVLWYLLPVKVESVVEQVRTHWGRSMLVGLAALVGGPLVAGVFFASIVGLPFGLVTLALYGAALVVACVLTPFVIGSVIARGDSRPWVHLAVGALVVAILKALPGFGLFSSIVIFLLVTVPVLGADLAWVWERVHLEKPKK